ncbi:hypothetical protein [Herbaspirillum sp. alder98]|uniref:hypothetical protein n=1 Tax=Herbaspirillum sp. alder98 TaxID=2913096 RepID=UPI001CD884DF|nr:hypothetical protein [Herbaspirillum sp. alder98]MCA1323608.1 hypothetical protein [Herbaspirillum sp. alder98]
MTVNTGSEPDPHDAVDLARLCVSLGGLDLGRFEAQADDMPAPPMSTLAREEDGMRPPSREALDSMAGESQLTQLVEAVRQEAQQGFSSVLAQAAQWLPAPSTRTAVPAVQMGSVMELRDLMASSRRSLGGDNGADERHHTARVLGVASAVNLAQPLWNPAQASTYAPLDDPFGNNLLSTLLA